MVSASLPPMHVNLHCCAGHLILPARTPPFRSWGTVCSRCSFCSKPVPGQSPGASGPQLFSNWALVESLTSEGLLKMKSSSYFLGPGWCPLQPARILFLVVAPRSSVCFPLLRPTPIFKVATNSLSPEAWCRGYQDIPAASSEGGTGTLPSLMETQRTPQM